MPVAQVGVFLSVQLGKELWEWGNPLTVATGALEAGGAGLRARRAPVPQACQKE